MKIQDNPPLQLTYCLNIHPGESWRENFSAIGEYAVKVRDLVAAKSGRLAGGTTPFGLGLRLGRRAADELLAPGQIHALRQYLEDNGLYVFTINGFPYGQFHDAAVKEDVYRPDWQSPHRRDYTIALADILAQLLPPDVSGSISTLPCSYRSWITTPAQVRQMAGHLADAAAHLARLRARTGKTITLGLEPEPDCFLETTQELIAFFAGPLKTFGVEHLARASANGPAGMDRAGRTDKVGGMGEAEAHSALARHLGICFDTAHAAVEFEDLPASLRCLAEAGVVVSKVQLSAALSVPCRPACFATLEKFRDRVYLHQVKGRGPSGAIRSYRDLGDALAAAKASSFADAEWRVHFHVPLFFERFQSLQSTSPLLLGDFARLLLAGAAEHLEIETYTFNVLPESLRARPVTESIAKEYEWVLESLLTSPRQV